MRHGNALFVTLISIFVVGVGWELFELWAGIPVVEDYILDTTTDLIMGILGALSGYAYVVSHYIKTTTV